MKPLAESKDAAAQWSAARSFYSVPMARHRNTTNYLATHGARLLFGTDTPSSPTYANPPGLNGRMEMKRLVDTGLTPGQIFRGQPANWGCWGTRQIELLSNDRINPLFLATVQATEESVVNAMIAARTMTGKNGRTVMALPHDQLREILRKYNRLVK